MAPSPSRTAPPWFQPRSRRDRARRSGFSLVEVMIAATILVVGVLGALGTLSQITLLGESNQESTLAYQAARSMIERLQATPMDEVLQRYNADPADDPDGPGTAAGADFAVTGLVLQEADADGFCGRILLPLAADGTLREDAAEPTFGLPQDLSGDGVVDGLDHTEDKILLPVRVQVQWAGKSGNRTAEYSTLLGIRS